jgi:hypothetical protein
MELPWGGLKEVEGPGGKTTVEPELSNDDFNTVLAQAIKLAHEKE